MADLAWITITNSASVAAVPARLERQIVALGPWYLIRLPRGDCAATLTSRNGDAVRVLTLDAAVSYLDGRGTGPEMETEPLPEGVVSVGFH